MQSGRGATGRTAGTIRGFAGVAQCVAAAAVMSLAAAAGAQTFTAPQVVFAPTGANAVQTQMVTIALTAPSTIRSISIPIGFVSAPEFTLVDLGGCTEDGTTVNPVGSVCNLVVRFRPASAGLRTASLVVTDGNGSATAFGISGVGYYPQIAVTPAAARIAAGVGPNATGQSGEGIPATVAQLDGLEGVAADSFGNVYVVGGNTGNYSKVFMLDAFGNITTVAGGGSKVGAAADGGPATDAQFTQISFVTVDAAGNIYFSDSANSVVWRVAMSTSRILTHVAGNFTFGYSGDGGPATSAQLRVPLGLVTDGIGNLYISDSQNQRVRMVDPSGVISTVAGGNFGFNANPVPAMNASFAYPSGIAITPAGDLYLSDTNNGAVRKISGGMVSVVAGTGTSGYSGDGGPAVSAQLYLPEGIALGPGGDVYVVDGGADVVRKIQASDGVIESIVGDPSQAQNFPSGTVPIPSTSIGLLGPVGIAFDTRSNIYITDTGHNVVREITAAPGELQFPPQPVGTSSLPQRLKIANIGNAPLSLGSVSAADGTTSTNFPIANSATAPCGATVAAGSHCEYTVAFAPQVVTATGGEIDVTHVANNPNFNTVEPVYLVGGVAGPIVIGPATLPAAVLGITYNATVTASGGFGSLKTTVSGTLPPGIGATIAAGVVTLSGTPTATGSFTFTINASDVLGDSAAQTYAVQVAPATIPLALTETVHVSDAVTDTPQVVLRLAETVHVTDGVVNAPGLVLAVMEAVHVTDTFRDTPGLVLAVNETLHVTDGFQDIPGVVLAVTETVHVTDSIKTVPQLLLAVSETVHVTDGITKLPGLMLALKETVHVADAIVSLPQLKLAISEGVHVTDGVVSLPQLSLALTETVHVADGVAGTPGLALALTETIHVSDMSQATVGAGKQTQTISAPAISDHVYGDADFNVTASSSSGLPVRVTVFSGPATIANGTVDLTGAGAVTLNFDQAGDANTLAATTVQRSFAVIRAKATVTAKSFSRAFETPNPTLTYTLAGLVHGDTTAVISGKPVLITTAELNSLGGGYPITATQGTLSAANYTFSFAPGTLTVVGHTPQTITFNKIPAVPLSVGTLTLTAHSTSSLAVTYTVSGPANLSGNQLHLTGAGAVTVTASQAGSATFDAATPVSRSFTVTQ